MVCFTLLHGDDVDVGLKEDRQRRDSERQGSVAASTNGSADDHDQNQQRQSGNKTHSAHEDGQPSQLSTETHHQRQPETATEQSQPPQSDNDGPKQDTTAPMDVPIRTKPQEPLQESPQAVQEKVELEPKQDDLIQHATGTYKPGSAIADTDVGKEMLER